MDESTFHRFLYPLGVESFPSSNYKEGGTTLLKTYTLTIMYDDEVDEIEYINEEIEEDVRHFTVGTVDITDYWDDEAIHLISKMYDIGES